MREFVKKNIVYFVFFGLHNNLCFHLIVTLTFVQVRRHLNNKNKCVYFVLSSVCTNFDFRPSYSRSEKLKQVWFFAHLIVTLQLDLQKFKKASHEDI